MDIDKIFKREMTSSQLLSEFSEAYDSGLYESLEDIRIDKELLVYRVKSESGEVTTSPLTSYGVSTWRSKYSIIFMSKPEDDAPICVVSIGNRNGQLKNTSIEIRSSEKATCVTDVLIGSSITDIVESLNYKYPIEITIRDKSVILELSNIQGSSVIEYNIPLANTSSLSSYFKGCSLLNKVSVDLLSLNSMADNLSDMFNGCTSFDISKHHTIFSKLLPNNLTIDGIFKNSGITNINSDLFAYQCFESVHSLNSVFEDCVKLEHIHISSKPILHKMIIHTADSVFRNCSCLRHLPIIFRNQIELTSVSYAFENCTTLTGVDPNYLSYIPGSADTTGLFKGTSVTYNEWEVGDKCICQII